MFSIKAAEIKEEMFNLKTIYYSIVGELRTRYWKISVNRDMEAKTSITRTELQFTWNTKTFGPVTKVFSVTNSFGKEI